MLIDNSFADDKNITRLGFGIAGAIVMHVFIWGLFGVSKSQIDIPSEVFSPTMNVGIHFVQPTLKPRVTVETKPEVVEKKPVVKKVSKIKPIQKTLPKKLNTSEITPVLRNKQETTQFARKQPVKTVKPFVEVVPVVSGADIKGRRIQPKYPKRSIRMHQEGVVWLRVLISKKGERKDIKLHQSSKYTLLDQAAIKAVKGWTFEPNIVNGKPVKSWVEIPIEFKIK